MTRKLAAILSADVAGYSRLMGENEEATIHTLKLYRGIIDTVVQQHRGRVVDSPGDNLLAEFPSVLEAVQCAVAIQQEINAKNMNLPVQRRMRFRLAVQEEIAARITKALAVRLTAEEKEHMGQPYTSSAVAWDLFMQGTVYYRKYTQQDNATAREFFVRAIQEDPEFVRARANLSATYRQDWTFAWASDLDAAKQEARRQADLAVSLAQSKKELASSLPYAYQQLAYVHMYSGEIQEAVARAAAAVKLEPQYADGHAALAQMLIYDGQPQAALAEMEEAKKWNPKPPAYYLYTYRPGILCAGSAGEADESF